MNKLERFIDKADNFIDSHLPQSEESIKRRKKVLITLGSLAAVTALTFGGKAIHDKLDAPTFSDKTHSYSVGHGEGLNQVAATVDGVGSVDIRDVTDYIKELPSNKDVLKDGLQEGESVDAPDSAKE